MFFAMKRTLTFLLILVVAVTLLAACGGGATPAPTTAPAATPTKAPEPTKASEPTEAPEPTKAPAAATPASAQQATMVVVEATATAQAAALKNTGATATAGAKATATVEAAITRVTATAWAAATQSAERAATAQAQVAAAATATASELNRPACTVRSNGLRMRSGPGTVYEPPVAVLKVGDRLDPLAYMSTGFPGAWVQVALAGGSQKGWVSAAAGLLECNMTLDSLPAGKAPPTPVSSPTPKTPPTATTPPTAAPAQLLPAPTFTEIGTSSSPGSYNGVFWEWPYALGPNEYFVVHVTGQPYYWYDNRGEKHVYEPNRNYITKETKTGVLIGSGPVKITIYVARFSNDLNAGGVETARVSEESP